MRHVACESIPYSGVGRAAASFILAQTDLLWPPGVACGLAVPAVAQMGVHLVFFMHIGTDSERGRRPRRPATSSGIKPRYWSIPQCN
jgi:hypothetical protein